MMHPSIWMHWTNLDSSLSGKYASKLNSMPVLQETHPYISWLMKILSLLSFVAREFDDQVKYQRYYSVYATSPEPYHHHHALNCISANWSLSTFHVHVYSQHIVTYCAYRWVISSCFPAHSLRWKRKNQLWHLQIIASPSQQGCWTRVHKHYISFPDFQVLDVFVYFWSKSSRFTLRYVVKVTRSSIEIASTPLFN